MTDLGLIPIISIPSPLILSAWSLKPIKHDYEVASSFCVGSRGWFCQWLNKGSQPVQNSSVLDGSTFVQHFYVFAGQQICTMQRWMIEM